MRWQGRRRSQNIEDRRGRRSGAARAGGVGGLGLIVVLLLGMVFGVDVSSFMGGQGGSAPQVQAPSGGALSDRERARGEFVAVALADTEDMWSRIFREQLNAQYNPAKLVLYSQVTESPCGSASGATGPFYCPADRKIYLDTSFFDTMAQRMGAGGDFAAAYVVAHEVAHHVQNELGFLPQANAARARMGEAQANAVSVMIELQADCFSGIWARYAQDAIGVVEAGDLEEAVNAAKQIGDDTIARNAGRVPMPHTYTHGTSKQRSGWFVRGYQSADITVCDTFSADRL